MKLVFDENSINIYAVISIHLLNYCTNTHKIYAIISDCIFLDSLRPVPNFIVIIFKRGGGDSNLKGSLTF